MAGMISSALMLVVILAIGYLFEPLPNAVLAAIIIVALKGMFMQFKDLCKLYKVDLTDMSVWLVTYIAVTFSDVDIGLIIGVLFSFLTVTFRTQRPYVPHIGNIPDTELYKDTSTYPAAEQTEGVCIIRFESNLYYANCEHLITKAFKRAGVDPRSLKIRQVKIDKKIAAAQKKIEKLEKKMEKNGPDAKSEATIQELKEYIPTLVKPEPPLSYIILDLTSLGFLDSMGCSYIVQLVNDFKAVKVGIYLAGCKSGIREKLEVGGVFDKLSRDNVFLTTHDAVLYVKHKMAEEGGNQNNNQKLNSKEEKTFL
jgi:MFS superfamily sulfate permease-like transporter